MTRVLPACVWILLCVCSIAYAQAPALTVLRSSPQGEIAGLDEANEIRIVFSEPMVALGRIPDRVTAPFVRITPAIQGTFRWSGTTILIFTPDPKQPLPFATTYEVRVGTDARAVSGRTLAQPVTFRFTTPTVKLLRTISYRRDGTVNSPMVVLMRFNQPVRSADVSAALSAALEPHEWNPPSFTPPALARLKTAAPAALERFNQKVAAVRSIAGSRTRVQLRPTTNWDQERYPPSPDLLAYEIATVAP